MGPWIINNISPTSYLESGATQLKPLVLLFNEMSSIGNGTLERFLIIVGDCRKYNVLQQNEADQEVTRSPISTDKIYAVLKKYDRDSDFTFYLQDDAVR